MLQISRGRINDSERSFYSMKLIGKAYINRHDFDASRRKFWSSRLCWLDREKGAATVKISACLIVSVLALSLSGEARSSDIRSQDYSASIYHGDIAGLPKESITGRKNKRTLCSEATASFTLKCDPSISYNLDPRDYATWNAYTSRLGRQKKPYDEFFRW